MAAGAGLAAVLTGREKLMARKTELIVYVDANIMNAPIPLFDVAYTHMIKKEVDIAVRKRFMSDYMRAVRTGDPIKVINEWIQIRDVATFPFRKEETSADKGAKGRVSVDDGTDGKQK